MLDLMQGLEPYVISAFLVMMFIIVINSRETKYFKFYKDDKHVLLKETIILISLINDFKRAVSEYGNINIYKKTPPTTINKLLVDIKLHVMYGRLSGELYIYHSTCNVLKDAEDYLSGELSHSDLLVRINKLDTMLNDLFNRLRVL